MPRELRICMAGGRMTWARHLLSYADSLRGGGVERALLRLAEGWIAAGRRVTLVIGDPRGPLTAELPPGVEVVPGPLVAAVRRLRPDLVFCPGNHYTSRAAWLRLRLGGACPPLVAKMSNALARPDFSGAVAWGYRRWLGIHPHVFDALVAMTPASRDETIETTGIVSRRVSVIANPPARVLTGAPPVVLPPGRFLLGVGRLVPQKRWDRLVAVLPLIADREVVAVVLGEGRERRRLERQAARLGVADRLWLPGHVADPLPALARATLAVLPSDYEGVPGVLREALSVGTPVVATDSSRAIREIVTGPELGSVVGTGDQAALVDALDRWLDLAARRPAPVTPPGEDAAAEYLQLFDALVAARA